MIDPGQRALDAEGRRDIAPLREDASRSAAIKKLSERQQRWSRRHDKSRTTKDQRVLRAARRVAQNRENERRLRRHGEGLRDILGDGADEDGAPVKDDVASVEFAIEDDSDVDGEGREGRRIRGGGVEEEARSEVVDAIVALAVVARSVAFLGHGVGHDVGAGDAIEVCDLDGVFTRWIDIAERPRK